MKIYTKTGDSGETGLYGGERVSKSSAQITAIGEVDELNSWIGVLRSYPLPDSVIHSIAEIQNDLFDLGGRLAQSRVKKGPKSIQPFDSSSIQKLETWIDDWQKDLPPLKQFILPAGSPAVAASHYARAVCRRAERALVEWIQRLGETEDFRGELIYLNRLSDLFFVLARWLNHSEGGSETFWNPGTA